MSIHKALGPMWVSAFYLSHCQEFTDMKFSWRVQSLMFTSALYCAIAAASPTNSDFLDCHRMAASKVQACLDRNPGTASPASDPCWEEARSANMACYDAVYAYSRKPDRDRIEAQKKARQKQHLDSQMKDIK